MKLKVQAMIDATEAVAKIINSDRPMPLKGKYRMARLHAKLFPEYTTAIQRRDAMITAYGFHPMVPPPASQENPLRMGEVESEAFAVPPDKTAEFTAAWAEIGSEEIEVDVEPIPLAQLDLGDAVVGSITANELITLGPLVKE